MTPNSFLGTISSWSRTTHWKTLVCPLLRSLSCPGLCCLGIVVKLWDPETLSPQGQDTEAVPAPGRPPGGQHHRGPCLTHSAGEAPHSHMRWKFIPASAEEEHKTLGTPPPDTWPPQESMYVSHDQCDSSSPLCASVLPEIWGGWHRPRVAGPAWPGVPGPAWLQHLGPDTLGVI